jgi:hypothetical protein
MGGGQLIDELIEQAGLAINAGIEVEMPQRSR